MTEYNEDGTIFGKYCTHDNLIDEELEDYGRAICIDCLKEIPKKDLFDYELKQLEESK
jgi:hypothetical protein